MLMEIIPFLFNNSFDFQLQLFFLQDDWFQNRRTEDFHPRVTVDQAEGLCHRITLHFGRLYIETGALY